MLQLVNISKQFPGVKALDGVSFEVQPGEIHALCGENGAGKSTLLNILTGNLQPNGGTINLNGKPIMISGPAHATELGLAIVYQQLSLVDGLSVAENIFANRQPHNRWGMVNYRALNEAARSLLQQLNLTSIRPETPVSRLSPGQKQMVEIAKALSQNPDILLLDEPTASITERETQTLFQLIRQLKAAGKAIVYISHRLNEIFAIADRVSVLKDGRYQGTWRVSDITSDQLIRHMVGRDIINTYTTSSATDEVLLAVENLSGFGFDEISFQLHRGEILGLAGLVGAGRTEIARTIFGADRAHSGTIELNGTIINVEHPADAIKLGIGYLPEERKTLGIFADRSVADNLLATDPPTNKTGWYDADAGRTLAEEYRKALTIRTPTITERIANLSGGNQQKVVLARWLRTNPDVLIVDEPTHGVDVGAKAEIYDLLRQVAEQGKGVLLISSELPELLALSDRILVIREGRLSGELSGSEATEEQIMALATH
ncbi:ribose transport system ATP-binding protein [Fibrisoma limi BUZ 3]|uniref:Ribose transport system ATP-binding protein n=1 Tax=Fibrisoma limi BUZ 3 TaxID=1185876 RepID=I2GRU0_9BACT|nr:sugar ABC transporter ATP-binding protein [Fibrisoma limi]CCH56618.1 ribose transport system ATP-binding protein [Fibrisoma limi BUZ 3]